MTFRARPVTRRPGRAGWDSGTRRTTLINAGFAGAIVVSIIILLGYAAWTWYDGHFGAAATVDGVTITRDAVRTRLKIEKFRLDYTEGQVRAYLQAGHISQAVAAQELQFLDQRRQSLTPITLEKLIDVTLQDKLAADAGITVTDAEVDQQLVKEATVDEQRHVWMIEVEPTPNAGTGQVGEVEKAAAKAKADRALADLKAGKTWDDVAKAASTAASAPQAGDLGWIPKDSGYDEKLMTAVFGAAANTPTDVILGDDGTYRIGRVTEITPATVDAAFQTKLEAAGITLADYRVASKADVVRTRLTDKVVADLSQPSAQRHVLQIKLDAVQPTPDGVKVRHILFAPKDDAGNAQKVPADDPAWAKAKADAEAAYNTLLVDPDRFDQMARTMSDETSAKTTGGKQPFYTPNSSIDKEFGQAIFVPGLRPGQILPPFKSQFGWHVVQILRPYGDGNQAWLEGIKAEADAGTDFAALARDQGDGDEASKGGDIGWIAKGQLSADLEKAIFDATIGKTSEVVDVASDGDYLFKILAEETRPATPEQIKVYRDSGFTSWYSDQKAKATITRATDSSQSATG
jgi:parvulin-like peptidyl-prolyl isomerase